MYALLKFQILDGKHHSLPKFLFSRLSLQDRTIKLGHLTKMETMTERLGGCRTCSPVKTTTDLHSNCNVWREECEEHGTCD